ERMAGNLPGLVFQFVRYPGGERAYRYVSENVRTLGLSPEEARRDAEALIDRIHPDDRPGFESSVDSSANTLGRWQWEGRYILPDGRFRWFHGTAQPEMQPGGAILWDGVIVDITRLKAAEQEVRKLNTQLESRVAERTSQLVLANQELEAFTYSVSHDLKTPLLSIRGFAEELIELLPEAKGETKEFLDRILASAKRMEVLIEAMLSLSRIAYHPLERQEIDLSSIALDAYDALTKNEPNRKVVFAVEPGLICRADGALARIVLENLIRNSWKFSREREVAHIRFHAERHRGQTVFTIEDDGAGFDPAVADQIFQPFTRLHDPGRFEGTGVGLATVRRVIQRHGGRIWAEGRPGKGAAFHFTFGEESSQVPVARGDGHRPPPPAG
ncbi:MAG: sensor histidine kinase, partial [Myxococcota bacterium]